MSGRRPETNEEDALEAALALRRRGFSIIACNREDKVALHEWKVYQERPATEDEVRAWWHRWPKAAVAIVTGRLSGVVVVDVDDPRPEATAAVEAHFGATPWKSRVRSLDFGTFRPVTVPAG